MHFCLGRTQGHGGVEKGEPVSAGFSLLLPLSSLASIVEGVSLFILVQGIRLCFDRQWGVSHCILQPGGPPRRVGQDWYRQGKSRWGLRTREAAGEGVNSQGFGLSLWTPRTFFVQVFKACWV